MHITVHVYQLFVISLRWLVAFGWIIGLYNILLVCAAIIKFMDATSHQVQPPTKTDIHTLCTLAGSRGQGWARAYS